MTGNQDFQEGADTLIISYGITSRSARVAVEKARKNAKKVSALTLQTLFKEVFHDGRREVWNLPFEQTSRKVDRLAIAAVALASLLKESGMFPLEALTAALSMFQKPAIAERTIAAARAGFDLNVTPQSCL